MPYSTSTTATFVLQVGQSVTAVLSTSTATGLIGVAGSSNTSSDQLASTVKVYGPYSEAKVISITPVGGNVIYDFGLNPANPPFVYSAALTPIFSAQNPVTGAAALTNNSLTALSNSGVGPIRPSGKYAVSDFGSISTTVPGAVTTYAIRRQVPFPFYGARVIQYNASTALPAANNMQHGIGTPSDINSAVTALAPVTWNGLTSAGSAGAFKGSPSGSYELALSDMALINSVPRTDGGSGFLIEHRTVVATQGITYSLLAGDLTGDGLQYKQINQCNYTAQAAGDFVTTNVSGFGTPTPPANGNVRLGDLLLFTDSKVWMVASGGDSLEYGQFGTFNNGNEFRKACDALTLAGVGNFVFAGCAGPGTTAAQFGYRAAEYIRKVRPHVFFYTVTSPNGSPPSVDGVLQAAKARLIEVIAAATESGVRLAICTQAVWNPFGITDDNALKSFNAGIQAFAASLGLVFYDRYALTSNGAIPSQSLPGYTLNAGTSAQAAHLVDAGYTALQSPAAVAIRQALAV